MAPSGDTPSNQASAYVLDASQSRFVVRVTAAGLLSAFGHNPTVAIRNFTGEARFLPDSPQQSTLRLVIDADSLTITGDVNEKDRAEMESAMKRDVLETAAYPEIRFEGSAVEANSISENMYRVKLSGQLILHGVTRNLELPCNIIFGGDRLRANGEFTIRQTDYQIQLVSAVAGTLKVKDELRFSFDVAGRRQGT